MDILLDVEPFNNPGANLKLLDTFFYIKEEIMKSLLPIKEKILLSDGCIVVIFTPAITGMRCKHMDSSLANEITILLNDKLDLSQIAEKMLSNRLN